MNNRKARLLLGVPAHKVGKASKYNISNRGARVVVGEVSGSACKPSRAQRRNGRIYGLNGGFWGISSERQRQQ